MLKKLIPFCMILGTLGLSGCSGDGGPNHIGTHGTDSTLSDNKLEGLYLFKIESNNITMNLRSDGDVKVSL